MAQHLWTWDDLVSGAGGTADGAPPGPVTGVAIDTRSLAPGDIFVALTDARDGHDFVADAFGGGASAALVSRAYVRRPGDGALLRVDDPLKGLERLGIAARRRLSPEARVIAITGSAGKTGTKEMARLCLSRLGQTHASERSYNNHWGVPLSLARMPSAARYGVFEIGMNHAGEIAPLTRMVRPHAAIVTTVAPVHLAHFDSVAAIAEAKAEIFEGLEPGGTAILNRHNEHFGLMAERARAHGARVIGFGTAPDAEAHLTFFRRRAEGSAMLPTIMGERVACVLGAPGRHLAMNAVAVLAAVKAVGGDPKIAASALRSLRAAAGRGARHTLEAPGGRILLIDESYNANPASMRAALATMATLPRDEFPRRIAVLGDMLELGSESRRLHDALTGPIDRAWIDLVLACGPWMKGLFATLPISRQGAWAETSDGLREALLATVKAGDAVMIKGSLGSRMAPLVEALKARFVGENAAGTP